MLLPEDVVCTYDLEADQSCCTQPLTRSCCTRDAPCIPANAFGADIGPKSAARFAKALHSCKTIFWNGPMGKFEVAAYAHGTSTVAHGIAENTQAGAMTIVGGAQLCSVMCHCACSKSLFNEEAQATNLSTGTLAYARKLFNRHCLKHCRPLMLPEFSQ